ncbi:MAG TPA: DNA-formamidopyrimidine glycosylase [Polyangia bacterium]|nr:DNA-formamidopyrimidine glycosylase [Polyangia bacterium]
MPELPEVEVAARNLRRWAIGRRVRTVQADARARRILRPAAPRALAALAGARFEDVRRRGKNLLVTLTKGRGGHIGIWSHLGMTGKWLRRRTRDAPPRFARVRIDLDDGVTLHYADMRLFGRFRLVPDARFESLADIAALGPDPLNDGIDVDRLKDRLARTRLPIKVAILDQTLLPGVGNIQASEGLFRAGIDPRRAAKSLSRAELARLARGLLDSIRYTLKTFKQSGADGAGSDIEYVEERRIANPSLVYGRAGEPCPRHKRDTIVRIVQAQRATFFCRKCQR